MARERRLAFGLSLALAMTLAVSLFPSSSPAETTTLRKIDGSLAANLYSILSALKHSESSTLSFETFGCSFRGPGAGHPCHSCKDSRKDEDGHRCQTCADLFPDNLMPKWCDADEVRLSCDDAGDADARTTRSCVVLKAKAGDLVRRLQPEPSDNAMGGWFSLEIFGGRCTKLKDKVDCRFSLDR
jgi:hypothetical protein